MSDKLLNEGCFFQCSVNASILITAKERNNKTVKDNGKKILTDAAECIVSVPLPCSILSSGGTPVMCQMKQTVWKGTNSKIKCDGRPVLTTKSSINCIYGGEIKPKPLTCISVIEFDTAGDFGTEIYPSENKEPDFSDAKKTNVQPTKEEDSKENKSKEAVYASHIMCDYENCSERSTCDYFNSQIFVINNSAKLSNNFQKLRKDEWNTYKAKHNEKLMELSEGSWSIAAHHIISGNQVLMMKEGDVLLFGHMIKLANYFHYDINNAENCIMLPTNAGNFGEKKSVSKTANAYEVMWLMGRQWHVGGHKYSLSKDTLKILEEYYKKHPEQCLKSENGEIFTDYATAVKEELDKLNRKYSRPRCWKKNYEKRRQKFIDDMNSLSAKIEQYLLNFEREPKASFPFYVSKTAFEYAFNLPSSVKVIIIYKENDILRAKKVRMERYKKDKLQIIPKEKGDMEITDIKSLAAFCENAMYFVVDEQVNAAEQEQYCFQTAGNADDRPLLWRIKLQGKDLQKTGVMNYLAGHGNEIFAFIQQKDFPYQPIARLVSVRGG